MKTTIVDALKDNPGTRLTYKDRWMIWDKDMIWGFGKSKGAWIVYDYNYERDKTQIICTTENAEMAVKYLLYKEVIK